MDLVAAFERLWAHKFLVFLALVLAAAAVVVTRYSVNGSGLTSKRSVSSVGSVQVLVDTRYSSLARVDIPTTASSVTERTPLYADYAASVPLKDDIAAKSDVDSSLLSVSADTSETDAATGGEQSTSYNIAPAPNAPYKVVLTATDALPIITINASAPSPSRAISLVNSTVSVLQSKVTELERTEKIRGPNRMVLRPLGSATGGTITSTPSVLKSALVGAVLLIVLLLFILLIDSVRRRHLQIHEAPAPA